MATKVISSKDNPLYKQLKLIAKENTAYRQSHQIWLEGEHLCQAALDSGLRFSQVVLLDTASHEKRNFWAERCGNIVQLPLKLMASLSSMPSPSWIGGVLDLPHPGPIDPNLSAVVLDKIQDPGNAGAILRSAAAFGFKQIMTTSGTVALWSTKVIRSAMGAHFNLTLNESIAASDILEIGTPVLVTDVHQGEYLHTLGAAQKLPWPCVWVFGHEGQGVSESWSGAHIGKVRIAQPGGQESLNVAAAAAICMHASASQRV